MIHQKRKESVSSIEEAHLDKLGVSSTDEVNAWYTKAMRDEYKITGIKRVCRLLMENISRPVWIFGDYDVDGICATSIIYRALKWTGFKNVHYRLPHRFSEGFGLNKTMVDEITDENAVIITVDNGIAALEAVSYAKEKGFTVIVTDHHEPVVDEDGNAILPKADIIIDPVAIPKSAGFRGYCGAGIAYKIAKALMKNDRRIQSLLPLAALATVCDHMKLINENFYIVRAGLMRINRETPICVSGLLALIKVLDVSYCDTSTFGYMIGPCVNAPERLQDGGAEIAVRLFTEDDLDKCTVLANTLIDFNYRRKVAVSNALSKTATNVNMKSIPYPLVIYVPDIGDGIIGIIAGELARQYNVPAAVFTDCNIPGFYKGSLRSIDGYNVKANLDKCRDLFEGGTYGGHVSAGGATIKKENFESLREALIEQAETSAPVISNVSYYDVEIKNEQIEEAILENERFQPFGEGNEDLVFKVTGFKVYKPKFLNGAVQQIGSNGLKFRSYHSDAVGFGLWKLGNGIEDGTVVTLYGSIGFNVYNGKRRPQIIIEDLKIEKQ